LDGVKLIGLYSVLPQVNEGGEAGVDGWTVVALKEVLHHHLDMSARYRADTDTVTVRGRYGRRRSREHESSSESSSRLGCS
jgi:hypothetical protein